MVVFLNRLLTICLVFWSSALAGSAKTAHYPSLKSPPSSRRARISGQWTFVISPGARLRITYLTLVEMIGAAYQVK